MLLKDFTLVYWVQQLLHWVLVLFKFHLTAYTILSVNRFECVAKLTDGITNDSGSVYITVLLWQEEEKLFVERPVYIGVFEPIFRGLLPGRVNDCVLCWRSVWEKNVDVFWYTGAVLES
jgi:hypothetical protein